MRVHKISLVMTLLSMFRVAIKYGVKWLQPINMLVYKLLIFLLLIIFPYYK